MNASTYVPAGTQKLCLGNSGQDLTGKAQAHSGSLRSVVKPLIG